MLNTFNTSIDSIKGKEVTLTSISVVDALICSIKRKQMKYFEFIHFVLKKITDISKEELENITVSDAVSLLVYYRLIDWSEFEATAEPKLYAHNFIEESKAFKDGEVYEDIGGHKFSPFIKLSDALVAEVEWFKEKEDDPAVKARLLPIHLLATAHIDGYNKGIKALRDIPSSPETIGMFERIDNLIMQTSSVNLSLFHSSGKICVISEEVGGERYSLPFQRSFFLTFDV